MKTTYKHYDQVDSLVVYDKITELISRQEIKKTIRVDTLSLIFGLNHDEIIPLLEELEVSGRIERHQPATLSKKSAGMGTVSLL